MVREYEAEWNDYQDETKTCSLSNGTSLTKGTIIPILFTSALMAYDLE